MEAPLERSELFQPKTEEVRGTPCRDTPFVVFLPRLNPLLEDAAIGYAPAQPGSAERHPRRPGSPNTRLGAPKKKGGNRPRRGKTTHSDSPSPRAGVRNVEHEVASGGLTRNPERPAEVFSDIRTPTPSFLVVRRCVG